MVMASIGARLGLATFALWSLCGLGCSTVRSSSVPTSGAEAYAGRVVLSATQEPSQAVQVGIVEANARNVKEFPDLIARFADEVAKVGGDYGKIDSIVTKYETVTRNESYQYKCGQNTCYGTRTVSDEIGITTVQGRAFKRQAGGQ